MSLQASIVALMLLAGVDSPDVNTVVDQAIRASAGKENLSRIKSATVHWEGEYCVDDVVFKIKARYSIQVGVGFRLEHRIGVGGRGEVATWLHQMKRDTQSIAVLTVFDGKKGVARTQRSGDDKPEITSLNDEQRRDAADFLHNMECICLPSSLEERGHQLAIVGKENVSGKATVCVKVTHPKHMPLKLYYDCDSGLLAKAELLENLWALDNVPVESIFSKHARVEGVMIPQKIVSEREGQQFREIRIKEIKLSDKPLDRSLLQVDSIVR
jgi:hypothetical protein